MKRITTIILLMVLNTAFIGGSAIFAQCTNCRNSQSNHHLASSAIGVNNIASGRASFACGMNVQASGMESAGIGSMIHAEGERSLVLGSRAYSPGQGSMIIGAGFGENPDDLLENNIDNSLMVGFNSIYPTLFVSPSLSRNGTGKIGIGNVTAPEAKLHIRSEHGEGAGLYVEQENFRNLNFWLGNKNHGLKCVDDVGMIFMSENNYLFESGKVGIKTLRPDYDLDVQGSTFTKQFILYDSELYKENIEGWVLRADRDGHAYWVDPRIFNDNDWTVIGNDIYRVDGYVGIGTTQNYGYKLAVDGGVLAEEVTVKLREDWPDYVFEEDYQLLPLKKLDQYIRQNKHLPGMPLAEHVKEEGLNLGEMQSMLLRKIEELTLYIILQESRIKDLEGKTRN
ncbi:MAG: hypothetical protein V2I47_00265 [Bacteroidales bacterium]|nr:hypothetical protein [Bacteroidales bacterium]